MPYIIVTVTYLYGVAGCGRSRLGGRIVFLCRCFQVWKRVVEVVWYDKVGQLAEPATRWDRCGEPVACARFFAADCGAGGHVAEDSVVYSALLCDRQVTAVQQFGQHAQAVGIIVGNLATHSDRLNDRQTRKPSAHTMKAYRQDFLTIATLISGGVPAGLAVSDIRNDSMRAAFAVFARDHEAASIRRCWSTLERPVHIPFHARAVACQPRGVGGPAEIHAVTAHGAPPSWALPSANDCAPLCQVIVTVT